MEFLKDGKISGLDIICVSTSDWDYPYGSRQQVMSGLADNGNRVLYIEAQLSLLHVIKDGLKGLSRLRRCLRGIREVKKGLFVYTPLPLLPFGNFSLFINKLNQNVLAFAVRRLAGKLGFRKGILWVYSVNSAALLDKLTNELSVYYCVDDFASEINISKRKAVVSAMEVAALKRADVVFACTRKLAQGRQLLRPDIIFVRNGVNIPDLKEKDAAEPDELKGILTPRIGFVGTLDSRIDTKLILFLAQSRKHWQFVIIGRDMGAAACLRGYPNIHLLGEKQHESIPQYLSAMDLCIVPYRTEGFNSFIFPLKVLEYLAAGKPVVSTYLSELEELSRFVRLSKTPQEFLVNIEHSLEKPMPASELKAAVSGFSWDSRLEMISQAIAKRLSKRRKP